MTKRKVTTREEWLAVRGELLAKEKELTRRGDQLAAERRELPWVPIEKEYTFGTDQGPQTLRELFGGRSQLMVYHFLDRAPLGRNEGDPPQLWLRRHDEYHETDVAGR